MSIELFQSAIDRDPKFARAHAGLGEAYWRKHQITRDDKWSKEALIAINNALSIDPEDASVRLALGNMYRGMGRIADAADQFRRVIEETPTSDEAHRQLGTVLLSLGKPDEALSEIKAAIDLRPEYWAHHYALGSALYNLGRFKEAADAAAQVIHFQRDSTWGYSLAGAAHHAMDDTTAALEFYTTAAKKGSAAANANLGVLHSARGEYEHALRAYEKALETDPASPLLLYNMGCAYSHLKREGDARASFQRALALSERHLSANPGDTRALARRAVIESKLGLRKEATAHIGQALAREPKNADVHFAHAIVNVRVGRLSDAVEALSRAVECGYSLKRAGSDPDLAPLRQMATFESLFSNKTGGGAQ